LKKAGKDNKNNKQAKHKAIDKINTEFFVPFMKEIKKTTKAAGIHLMSVNYPRVYTELLSDFKEINS